MKQRFSLIIFMLLLTGCRSTYTFSEISIDHANDRVQEFIKLVEQENGHYLYLDDDNGLYVFLNGIYVRQGHDALYFSDFNVIAQQGILSMFINQESDSDYSNRNLNYQVLYKINTAETYDMIILFINGKPVSFDKIYGNE
ncbi:hypothetical protein [Sporosarcina sp. YIM B06819]|uniref:hypothetical protein n=1 Tax=Sporosarcina sp. YIM B06819 TaxID=3081769 RepID=UPI00298CCC38|nr:hypothetical protein [Sporosarcina sp. YIM B06819]